MTFSMLNKYCNIGTLSGVERYPDGKRVQWVIILISNSSNDSQRRYQCDGKQKVRENRVRGDDQSSDINHIMECGKHPKH